MYYGNDIHAVRSAAHAATTTAATQGESITTLDADSYQSGVLQDAVGATSLFGAGEIYLIDTPSKEYKEEVLAQLDAMAASHNVFVVIEGPLLAPAKKVYAKHATTLEEHKQVAAVRFNAFGLADALARRDKKNMWVLLQQAKAAGLSNEEIIGTLWWQLKSVRLAAQTSSAADAGMKDFPYQKAKKALSVYSPERIRDLSHGLLTMYHQGHLGEVDLDLALEQWCLGV